MADVSNRTDISTSATERKFISLRRFNLVMGFTTRIQGVFMILVSNDTTYPIFTNYLNFDLATRSLKPNTELFYELPFGVAVSLFLLISACSAFLPGNYRLWALCGKLEKGHEPGALL